MRNWFWDFHSILSRPRQRRAQRAARLELFSALIQSRRVLYTLEDRAAAAVTLKRSGAASVSIDTDSRDKFEVVIGDNPRWRSKLDSGGLWLSSEAPSEFASRHLFGGRIWVGTDDPRWSDLRLHLGCGPITLPGWLNVDNNSYPGIDIRWDLSRGIPVAGARYIFAEHFIEHLSWQEGRDFLRACRSTLREEGILRLSTPNLDWVLSTGYRPWHWKDHDDAMHDCFVINRAFRAWGHQFLYNRAALEYLLQDAGFAEIRYFRYGESDTPELAGLERHERYPDTAELPHILVVEASGRRTDTSETTPQLVAEYLHNIGVR